MFIENSTFTANTANTATGKGGAIYNEGIMEIENSQFSSNESSQGGAILVAIGTGDLTVKNSTFTANFIKFYWRMEIIIPFLWGKFYFFERWKPTLILENHTSKHFRKSIFFRIISIKFQINFIPFSFF